MPAPFHKGAFGRDLKRYSENENDSKEERVMNTKAVRLYGKMDLRLEEMALPEVGPDDVQVKIISDSVCMSTHKAALEGAEHKRVPDNVAENPVIVGHEFCGVIESVGSSVTEYKPGEIVSGEGHIVCGHCRSCRSGQKHLCPNTKGVGVNRPGCFAEYLSIQQDNVVRIHKSIPMEIASIFDPLGNAVHTALSWDLVGEDVLITGAGVIGCMAAAVCKKAGAKTVVITDINDFRLGLAKTLGADRTVNVTREKLEDVMKELEMTEGFDVCLEMSGAPSCLKDIIDNSRNGANISLLGIQPDGSSIEWNKFIWKGLKMKGFYGREIFETWHKMDSMIRSGLNVAPIITHRLPYTEFREGFEAMNSGKSGKVVLDWIV